MRVGEIRHRCKSCSALATGVTASHLARSENTRIRPRKYWARGVLPLHWTLLRRSPAAVRVAVDAKEDPVKTTEVVYKAYIAAPAQRVWEALVRPEFTRNYWGHENVSDWRPGSRWEHRAAYTGEIEFVGRVIECDPPHRLVMTWADPGSQEPYDAQS